MLLAGGYFRARIQVRCCGVAQKTAAEPTDGARQGLSPFDKVIGGMAWAITNAAGDLDIDIFFQENAQIGQKM